jgi:hypothetical protein
MHDYKKATVRAAKKFGIKPEILLALIQQESGFNPHAKSGAGAEGIAQFMPGTAPGYGVNLHDNRVTDDLEGAAKYIRANLDKTGGNYHQALSIYNSGKPNAYKDPGFANGQTYNYVKTILGNAKNYRGVAGGDGSSAAPAAAGGSAPRSPFSDPITKTLETTQFDQAGYEKARRAAIVGNLLAKHNPNNPLLKRGLLTTQMPNTADFQSTTSQTLTGPKLERLSGQKLANGIQSQGYSPQSASLIQTVSDRISRIDAQKLPYAWGGGHGAKPVKPGSGVPVDCSGFVSSVLGINPRVSGAMGSAPGAKPGKGRVNVWYNGHHTLMEVNGHFAGTSATNPGGGAGWIPRSAISADYLKNFKVVHFD